MTKMKKILSIIFYPPLLMTVFGGIYATFGLILGHLEMIPQEESNTGLIIGSVMVLMGNLWFLTDRIFAAHSLLRDAVEISLTGLEVSKRNTEIAAKLVENQEKLFEILEVKSMEEESKARVAE